MGALAVGSRLSGHRHVKTGSCHRPDFGVPGSEFGSPPLTIGNCLRSNSCEGQNFRKIYATGRNCISPRGSCGSIVGLTPERRRFVRVFMDRISTLRCDTPTVAKPTWESSRRDAEQRGFPVLGEMVRMLPMRTCIPRPEGRTSSGDQTSRAFNDWSPLRKTWHERHRVNRRILLR